MGTTYSVKLAGPPAAVPLAALGADIDGVLRAVSQAMSTYLPDSELSRFNGHRGTEWVEASPALATVVAEALRVSDLTGGAFDVTVGPLVNLWGFGPEPTGDRVPTDPEVQAARAQVGHHHLHVRADPPALRKDLPDLYVDLSAIAKGYAVDRVAEHLEGRGIDAYLVEVGGELRARGRRSDGSPWRVAIERPSPGTRAAYSVLYAENVAVATSGDYRNHFERDGQRYSHTIDPTTGRPVTHPLASITVVSGTAMTADALATGLNVLGPVLGFELAERLRVPALFISRTGTGFTHRLTRAFGAYAPGLASTP
jgi:thiamine biosynthesis lipoprotein